MEESNSILDFKFTNCRLVYCDFFRFAVLMDATVIANNSFDSVSNFDAIEATEGSSSTINSRKYPVSSTSSSTISIYLQNQQGT